MLMEIPNEQLAAALDGCAREVLAEAAIAGPPVDALLFASRLGMVVAHDAVGDTRARFVRLSDGDRNGRDTILLADDPRPERRQWAVAHEIGESVAHRVFESLAVRPEEAAPASREQLRTNWPEHCSCPGDGSWTMPARWGGSLRAEAGLSDGQPRADRAKNVADADAGDRHAL